MQSKQQKKSKKSPAQYVAKKTGVQTSKVQKKQVAQKDKAKKQYKKAVLRERRFDPRLVATDTNNQVVALSTSISNVDFEGFLGASNMADFATGWLTTALSKAALAFTNDPYALFQAYGYVTRLLERAANGQQFSSFNVPFWLRNVLQALQPKSVPFFGGKATYLYTSVETAPDMPQLQPLGPTVWGYSLNWALPNVAAPFINGFPVCNVWAPPAYDEVAGSAAFQRICQLMLDSQKDTGTLVPVNSPTVFLKDPSAFAPCQPIMGYGASVSSTGYSGPRFAHRIESETPCFSPILAGLVNLSAFVNRYPVHNHTFGGDPIFGSNMMSHVLEAKEMHFKRQPIFKIVDFFMFYEVVASWVEGVQKASVKEFVNAQGNGAQFQCPLTLQEVGILLRNVMMGAFKNTQSGVQGLGPLIPTTPNDNVYCALQAGIGTQYISPTDMKLPVFLIENIRALVFRKNYPARSGSEGDPQYWIPILGKRVDDTLSHADYSYTIESDPPVTYSSFASPASVYEVDGPKGTTKVQVETPIDFIDGNSSSGYLAINDGDRLSQLVAMWNEWVNLIASHSTQIGSFGTELGISILTSICMTRHVNEITVGEKSGSRQLARKQDVRLKSHGLSRGNYLQMQAVLDSSAGVILSAPYEKILSLWILPVNLVRFQSSPTVQSTQLQRVQGNVHEPYGNPRVSGEDQGVIMADLLEKYASAMVKGQFAAQDDISQFLSECAAKGRGGILSALLGGVAKTIAGAVGAPPGVSGVIDSISGALPF
jgi:hypothetical protein